MKFQAEIKIMPHKELLDPQGKAVNHGLHNMGLSAIEDVRIGKHVSLFLECSDGQAAENTVKEACERLLVNKIMEQYTYSISVLES